MGENDCISGDQLSNYLKIGRVILEALDSKQIASLLYNGKISMPYGGKKLKNKVSIGK